MTEELIELIGKMIDRIDELVPYMEDSEEILLTSKTLQELVKVNKDESDLIDIQNEIIKINNMINNLSKELKAKDVKLQSNINDNTDLIKANKDNISRNEAQLDNMDGTLNDHLLNTIIPYNEVFAHGAKGDGVNNDTGALDAYIRDCQQKHKTVLLYSGKFKITNTIVIPYGNSVSIKGVSGDKYTKGAQIISNFAGIQLECQTPTTIEGLTFVHSGSRNLEGTIAVKCKMTEKLDDMDCAFYRCVFRGHNVGISAYGRGLQVRNCTFIYHKRCINRRWIVDEVPRTRPNNAELPNGYRADVFSGNRFHDLGANGFVLEVINDGGDGFYTGAQITNNLLDLGGNLLQGVFRNALIANNVLNVSGSTQDTGCLHFDKVYGTTITGNIFSGEKVVMLDNNQMMDGNYKRCIHLASDFENLTITNNTFTGWSQAAMVVTGTSKNRSGMTISNNIINNCGAQLYTVNESVKINDLSMIGNVGDSSENTFDDAPNDNVAYVRMNSQWVEAAGNLIIDSVPIGVVTFYSGTSPPTGWLWMNNATINVGTYPELDAHVKANCSHWMVGYDRYKLPASAGQFIRGYDPKNTNDPSGSSRKIGTTQGDAIRNITGSVAASGNNAIGSSVSGVFEAITGGRQPQFGGGGMNRGFKIDASRVVPTAPENRPKNITFLTIIKAFMLS